MVQPNILLTQHFRGGSYQFVRSLCQFCQFYLPSTRQYLEVGLIGIVVPFEFFSLGTSGNVLAGSGEGAVLKGVAMRILDMGTRRCV